MAATAGMAHASYVTLEETAPTKEQAPCDDYNASRLRRLIITGTICGLLSLQSAVFVLMRRYLHSEACDSTVLMHGEWIKVLLALYMCWPHRDQLTERWHLAIPPVVMFVTMNLLSFWSIKRLPATLSIILIQMKLVWTALFSRIFLAKRLLGPKTCAACLDLTLSKAALQPRAAQEARSPALAASVGPAHNLRPTAAARFALVALFLGCIAVTLDSNNKTAADGDWGGFDAVQMLAIAGLLAETMISGAVSVYMQARHGREEPRAARRVVVAGPAGLRTKSPRHTHDAQRRGKGSSGRH